MHEVKKIVIISDGTGKTAKRLMDAVLAQYHYHELAFPVVNIFREVRSTKAIDQILREIQDEYLVLYSIISSDLSDYFHAKLSERGILHLNILEPMLATMSKFLGVHPDYEPGILHIIDDRYYRKVDAIGFTVEHDDGMGQMIEEAEIVLLGLSRTCKTPISMYLACNHGIKVANIPIVADADMEQALVNRLARVEQAAVFGLTMRPDTLMQVREERLHHLAHTDRERKQMSNYYDLRTIREELRYCAHLFERWGWHTIDVTRRAIEEVSLEIIEKRGLVMSA